MEKEKKKDKREREREVGEPNDTAIVSQSICLTLRKKQKANAF